MSALCEPDVTGCDLEEAFISACMQGDGAGPQELLGLALRDIDFEDPRLGLMYSAIVSLATLGVAIDPVTLANQLEVRGDLGAAGGREAIGQLIDVIPHAKNLPSYAKLIRERACRRELATTLAAAAARAKRSDYPLESVVATVGDMLTALRSERASPSDASYRTLGELIAQPELTAEPSAIVQPLLYTGRTTLLSSREKMGKSTLSAQLAAAVSTGRPFLGATPGQDTVLWYAIDEALSDAVRRLQRYGADLNRMLLSERRTTAQQMRDDIEQSGARVVFIDTLSELWAGLIENENDAQQVTGFLRPYVRVARELNVALMLSYHTSKAGREYRGSVALGATVDAPLTFNRIGAGVDRGALPAGVVDEDAVEDDGRRIISGTTRWGKVAMRLTFDGELYSVGDAPMPLTTRIIRAVRDGSLTVNQLSKELGKRKETVGDEVARLISVGLLDRDENTRLRLTPAGEQAVGG